MRDSKIELMRNNDLIKQYTHKYIYFNTCYIYIYLKENIEIYFNVYIMEGFERSIG